jgi:hypothetical protein
MGPDWDSKGDAMRKNRSLLLLALVVLVVCGAGVAGAEQEKVLTTISEIKKNPASFSNIRVTIEGFAWQWADAEWPTPPAATPAPTPDPRRHYTNFYYLKDDWGDAIKVRTSRERPVIGDRYRVSGVIGFDIPNTLEVFVSEDERVAVQPAVPVDFKVTPVPTMGTDVPGAVDPGRSKVVIGGETVPLWLVVAVCVCLACLIALVIWVVRSRRPAPEAPSLTPAPHDGLTPAAPPQAVEGSTIKIFAPPPGTLKMLPGRLDVVSGEDQVREIRFYKVKGQSTPEVTFGRAAGAPYTHVQLKPMTVSSRQAKLTFLNGQWVLTNFAPTSSNPTRVSGAELAVDGQASLKDGDRIEMGEVQFVFHAS